MHLFNTLGLVRDEEGVEAEGPEQAGKLAADNIRSMLSDEVRQGRIDLRGRIEIADQSGTVVRTVPFRDAIQLFMDEGA